ncbi:MAG: response regulator [Myxococcota bacterium]
MNAKKNPTLWLIDDSEADRILFRLPMEAARPSLKIVDFPSAESAIAAIKQGESPDVALLDLNMPGVGGFAFLEQLEALGASSFPIVILTSTSQKEEVNRAYALGAHGFATKPNDREGIAEFAQSFCGYWFELMEFPEV